MKYTIQIHSGSFESCAFNTQEIMSQLEKIRSQFEMESIIIGWYKYLDFKVLYDYCEEHAIELYAWLPVFSEHDALDLSPFVLKNGEILKPYRLSTQESFTFCCPSNPENMDKITEALLNHFPFGYFHGVFLDRIRYPSIIHGKEILEGCFCTYCQNNIIMHSDSDKIKLIYNQIQKLVRVFKNKKLKIGLDLFAEPLLKYVGQSYDLWVDHVVFIKPMYYHYTHAPAGLPFEINALKKEGIIVNYPERRQHYKVLNEKYHDFLRLGIEWNYIEHIAETSPTQLIKDLKEINESGISHIVLSWNAMLVPNEHIEAIGEFERGNYENNR
ncbi:MAG: hypothetical protein JXR88_12050 [Clostridia bacterium]|nr:hypothetical protein [Clostridia bacterium]